MSHDKILRELEDLLNIPEFKKTLTHRIAELKLLLSDDIGHYRNITGMIRPGKRTNPAEGIQFELVRLGNSLWIPSLTDQPDQPDSNVFDFIPQIVIDYIIDFDIEPGEIKMISALEFPRLKGRTFNLSFEKHREHFFTGIISERKNEEEDYSKINPELVEDINFNDMELLFHYLLNFPFFYKHILNEFKLMWKPLIDSDMQRKNLS